jgi:hypothetical protein
MLIGLLYMKHLLCMRLTHSLTHSLVLHHSFAGGMIAIIAALSLMGMIIACNSSPIASEASLAHVLSQIRAYGTIISQSLIQVLFNRNKISSAFALLDVWRHQQIQPNDATYHVVFKWMAKNGYIQQVIELLNIAHHRRIPLGFDDHASLCELFLRHGYHERALQSFIHIRATYLRNRPSLRTIPPLPMITAIDRSSRAASLQPLPVIGGPASIDELKAAGITTPQWPGLPAVTVVHEANKGSAGAAAMLATRMDKVMAARYAELIIALLPSSRVTPTNASTPPTATSTSVASTTTATATSTTVLVNDNKQSDTTASSSEPIIKDDLITNLWHLPSSTSTSSSSSSSSSFSTPSSTPSNSTIPSATTTATVSSSQSSSSSPSLVSVAQSHGISVEQLMIEALERDMWFGRSITPLLSRAFYTKQAPLIMLAVLVISLPIAPFVT